MNDIQKKLIQRIQAKDSAAESELFHQFKSPILWHIKRKIKTREEDIKDIASDVYLAILDGLRKDSFDPGKWVSIEAFIWGVTNNKIRDWFKKNTVIKKYISTDPIIEEMAKVAEKYSIETHELRQTINECLQKLESRFKEILSLFYYKELSISEISKKIGVNSLRVSERKNYALKLMKKCLQRVKNEI